MSSRVYDPCSHCGKVAVKVRHRLPEGGSSTDRDDACITALPGVRSACCGHGNSPPYLELFDGTVLRDAEAVEKLRALGGTPPALVAPRTIFHYQVVVRGLWGKKRKPGITTELLAKSTDLQHPMTVYQLLPLMHKRVTELRVRPGAHLTLQEQIFKIYKFADVEEQEWAERFPTELHSATHPG